MQKFRQKRDQGSFIILFILLIALKGPFQPGCFAIVISLNVVITG